MIAAGTSISIPTLRIVSRIASSGGRESSVPVGVDPVAAIATIATSARTTSAGRSARVALPRMGSAAGYCCGTLGSASGAAEAMDVLSQ